jgi:hypothetical protein
MANLWGNWSGVSNWASGWGYSNSNAAPPPPPIPKVMRVYTLRDPESFALQHMNEETKPLTLIEKKENGPGKCFIKSKI